MSPLMHTVSRTESNVGLPGSNPSLGSSPEAHPAAGLHRGSINGIPGGGLPGATSRSPIKESSFLARSASIHERDGSNEVSQDGHAGLEGSMSPPSSKAGIPIRR